MSTVFIGIISGIIAGVFVELMSKTKWFQRFISIIDRIWIVRKIESIKKRSRRM